jgi:hypothetical protein
VLDRDGDGPELGAREALVNAHQRRLLVRQRLAWDPVASSVQTEGRRIRSRIWSDVDGRRCNMAEPWVQCS